MANDLEAIRSELARIRALEEKATKGPWLADFVEPDGRRMLTAGPVEVLPDGRYKAAWLADFDSQCGDEAQDAEDNANNSAFTASARTDVPRLVKIAELAVEMLRDGHANFDCDPSDGAGKHPFYCRPCRAEKALADIARLLKEE